jgi:G-protein signaling modulator 2
MDDLQDDGLKCLELALEGERLCKSGDFEGGIVLFESALESGTTNLSTLSAIYSQLGNAYFYLGDYQKAFQFHQLDLTLTRTLSDQVGEAKASGNLGNTLKMLGKYDQAIVYCNRHLDIARRLKDKVGEGRALYNLGESNRTSFDHTSR